eukprot:6258095-Pyramimonas_sp.AAC.1
MEEVGNSTHLQEFVVSGTVAGAIVGAIFGGYLSDTIGRRGCLMWADVIFAVGSIGMALSQDAATLIAGRVTVGLGVGLASMCVPVYIAEVAPAESRAALVSVNNLLITTGQFCAFVVNTLLRRVPHQWRWMLAVCGLPAVLQLIGLLFLPESPRWLLNKV